MSDSLHVTGRTMFAPNQSDWDVDQVIGQIPADLRESVPSSVVRQTISTLFANCEDARVKTFVPLLVRREAIEVLRNVPMEIEARFIVPDPGTYWRLQTAERLAGYDLSTQKVQDLSDTYLDTKNRLIRAAGYSCRRRRQSEEGILMTLKSLSRARGAIHHRQEFEIALDSALPPIEWPDSPAREWVLQLSKQEPLVPLFELPQTRIIRLLHQDEQPLAEFSLDKVSLVANGKEHVFHELEIELRPSVPDQTLAAIVDCLQNEWHLQPEPLSKFERALALQEKHPAGY